MSKFLINLLLQISKALVNSKIQFLFEKNFPPNSAHSAQPACPLPRPWPAGRPKPSNPSPAQTAQPTWPLSRSARSCLWHILQKTFSSSVHAFPRRPLSPYVTTTWAPPVSFVVSPAPADLGRNFPHTSDAPEPLHPSVITPPS
jgi:hypothetical protein